MEELPLRTNRDFLLLNVGQFLSAAGSAFSSLAYPLLALSLTHSPAMAGLVVFARLLPEPLFGLAAGLVVDRFDRKRVMILADAMRAIAVGALAVITVFRRTYWPLPLLAFVEGAGNAFFATAQPGAVRALVPTSQLPAAISVQQGRSASVVWPAHRLILDPHTHCNGSGAAEEFASYGPTERRWSDRFGPPHGIAPPVRLL